MDKLNKDVLRLLAMELDYDDIMKFCSSSKKFNNAICNNNDFWRNKFMQKYGIKTESDNFRELYKLYNNTIVYNEIYNTPLYITTELLDFFLNADLGYYPRSALPIRDIIFPLLNLGILSRPIITLLFHIYFHKNIKHIDLNKITPIGGVISTRNYLADEVMKKYLTSYKLDEPFRFNKFILPITSRGVISDVTEEKKKMLNDPKISNLVSIIKELLSYSHKNIY